MTTENLRHLTRPLPGGRVLRIALHGDGARCRADPIAPGRTLRASLVEHADERRVMLRTEYVQGARGAVLTIPGAKLSEVCAALSKLAPARRRRRS